MKYENKTWKLLNVDELSRFKSGNNKGKMDYKNCIGLTLKYELKANGSIYEVKIVDYDGWYKDENNKTISPKFKVEYIFLKGTEYEEVIEEVKRRREIVNKYRFRIGWQGSVEANIKALDEVIDFAEEHKLAIDSAYIVWKGLDTEENIKKYLKDIDK